MTDTAEFVEVDNSDLITPEEAYAIASQWGSFQTNGDPGAVFYSFPGNDATPRGPAHRAQLIAYTKDCLADADADDKADLESLLAFFERMPATGEEFRATYADASQALLDGADDFARAYATAAVWTGVEYPYGDPRADSDRNNDLSPSDISPDALKGMIADCERFQAENKADLEEAYGRDGYGNAQWSAQAQAGHDFWLTRNGHGAGFWDRSALDADGLGDKLSEAARKFGECSLYTGDDGGVYIQ